jgi:hypothetical protein
MGVEYNIRIRETPEAEKAGPVEIASIRSGALNV